MAASACLDLNLQDDMIPMDGGPPVANTPSTSKSNEQAKDSAPLPLPDTSDTEPPEIVQLPCEACEVAEQKICKGVNTLAASLRFTTNEPAEVSLASDDLHKFTVITPPWQEDHLVGLNQLPETPAAVPVQLELTDINGNTMPLSVSIQTTEMPTIVITEILADPLGPEPQQEFVEILNLSNDSIDLTGWMIDDNNDANGDILPEDTLIASGQVAIIVSPDYALGQDRDPIPSPDALMIVLDSSIGSNGLKNAEPESIQIYDNTGTIISQYYGNNKLLEEGQSVVRRASELPECIPSLFIPEPNGTSTPGSVLSLEDLH